VPPHDALFKVALRNPSSAISLLRAALPSELLEAIDLSTLRVSDGNFVSSAEKKSAVNEPEREAREREGLRRHISEEIW
jgi:predicted transposase YdaD